MGKRRVILVTDGDYIARMAVEEAAKNIGGRCISRSAGNPTPRSGPEIVQMIKKAANDPVVVMVDDRGHTGTGSGEEAMDYIINAPGLDVLGVIAVASNTKKVSGIRVDCSVDKRGNIVNNAVDKNGDDKKNNIIVGDTVDILNDNDVPIIIGIGDPGKMDGCDSITIGAPIITKAMEEIIKRHDERNEKQPR
jgi:stage V sporulation protein AE